MSKINRNKVTRQTLNWGENEYKRQKFTLLTTYKDSLDNNNKKSDSPRESKEGHEEVIF